MAFSDQQPYDCAAHFLLFSSRLVSKCCIRETNFPGEDYMSTHDKKPHLSLCISGHLAGQMFEDMTQAIYLYVSKFSRKIRCPTFMLLELWLDLVTDWRVHVTTMRLGGCGWSHDRSRFLQQQQDQLT